MATSPTIVQSLRDMVRRRNRGLAVEVAVRAFLGIVFSLVTFGFVFWAGWFFGVSIAGQLNLSAWQFSMLFTGLFLFVATWSAWRRVDPMAGLQPLTDRQLLLTLISHASPHVLYFSPRHASAGLALILIGGPANVVQAIGIWAHRIRADNSLLENAARILASCQTGLPAEQVRDLSVAVLLKRLALIKVVPNGDSAAFALTDKGSAVLSGKEAKKGKRIRLGENRRSSDGAE